MTLTDLQKRRVGELKDQVKKLKGQIIELKEDYKFAKMMAIGNHNRYMSERDTSSRYLFKIADQQGLSNNLQDFKYR